MNLLKPTVSSNGTILSPSYQTIQDRLKGKQEITLKGNEDLPITYYTGYAGTGKSTLLAKHVRAALSTNKNILIIAPTHKAINVLKEKLGEDERIVYSTLHSILSLVPTINEDAEDLNELQLVIQTSDVKELLIYDYIFIDEAGMIDKQHFEKLISTLKTVELYSREDAKSNGAKIKQYIVSVYLDPYQLAPVRGKQITLPKISHSKLPDVPLRPKEDTRYNLTIQYRSNAIITSFYEQLVEGIKNSILIDIEIPQELQVSYAKAIEQFNYYEDISLAYTNKAVGEFILTQPKNAKLEKQLGNFEVISLGEKTFKAIPWHNSSKIFTQRGYVDERFYGALENRVRKSKNLAFIEATAISPQGDKYSGLALVIEGFYKHYTLNKEVDKYLIELNRLGRYDDKKAFMPSYYDVKNSFALDYAFARTVHKSQGSEWDNVVVNYADLQQCRDKQPLTYMRLLYVAASRAKNKLSIIVE